MLRCTGILNGKRYLIHDRDPLFTTELQNILASVGVTSVKLPLLLALLSVMCQLLFWSEVVEVNNG